MQHTTMTLCTYTFNFQFLATIFSHLIWKDYKPKINYTPQKKDTASVVLIIIYIYKKNLYQLINESFRYLKFLLQSLGGVGGPK